jgi:rare lipoprotein A
MAERVGVSLHAFAVALIFVSLVGGCAEQPAPPQAPPLPAQPSVPPLEPPAAAPPSPSSPPITTPDKSARRIERGRVSLYGADFASRKTASGERFDPEALTMAHRSLPFGTLVRVTNVENNRSVEVKVNDRGPAVSSRIADLSLAAARRIGMLKDGVVEAVIEVIALPNEQ